MQDVLKALQDAHSHLESIEVDGTAGGGAVRVHATAEPRITEVRIAAEALDDPELLGDLVAAAVNDALRNASSAAQDRLGGAGGGLGLPGT